MSPLFRFDENVENMVPRLQAHLQSYIDKVPTLHAMTYSNEEVDVNNENENINLAVINREKQWFSVSVNVVKGLRGNREDKEALLVQVKQTTKGTTGGKKEKICASCYLISVDAQEASFYSKNVAWLPLCLTCGDSELNKQIFQGLMHRFDCTIFPLEIPEEELMWMSALWSSIPANTPTEENNADESNKNTKVRYNTLNC